MGAATAASAAAKCGGGGGGGGCIERGQWGHADVDSYGRGTTTTPVTAHCPIFPNQATSERRRDPSRGVARYNNIYNTILVLQNYLLYKIIVFFLISFRRFLNYYYYYI